MNIGKYTTLEKVIKSETAIRHGIDNRPDAHQLHAIKLLAENIYDPLCDHFQKTIPINSWFRNSVLNSIIGGARNSQHVKGEALDLDTDGDGTPITNSAVFYWIYTNLDFHQLIWEYGNDQNPAWVHVSINSNGKNKKQVLKIRSRASGYETFQP
jgi:zinc D-Ala-D-Ala carboxypeptidase